MTISRSQIERQLREGGGIMEVVPREEAFLGGIKKAIKKVSKAVKNVAKSPIGKAAMLYFGGNLLQGNPMFGGNPFTGRITDFIKGKGTGIMKALRSREKISGVDKALGALKVGTAVGGLAGLAAAVEQGDEDAIQATTNVDSLRKYLRSSYINLGYDPERDNVDALVERDVSEYTSGAGGYATGGRVKYQQGGGIGSLGGGSQTTPTTGKASYAEGPQLYRDLIDYLQIEGPKPEMVNSEMMMNNMGGAMPAYGGSGSSGGTTGSSITSGSTGGGSGTGILQATPGTTQPTNTPPSNVAPSTTQAPTVSTSTFTAPGKNLATTLRAYEEDPTSNIQKYYEYYTGEKDYRKDAGFALAAERNEALFELGRKVRSGEFDPYKYKEEADRIKEYYAELNPLEYYGVRPDQMTYYDDRNNLINYRADGGRIGYASGTDKEGVRSIKPKKKPSAEKRILDMLDQNKQAAYNTLGPRNMFERMAKSAVEAYKNGEISKREFDRMIMPFFGRGGEMLTNKIDKERQYLDDVSMGKGFESGGRVEYAMGSPEDNARKAAGIMDLPLNENKAGVTELDLRETGGFIPPVGVKEKADDIPAMLSNNEFVFTADAVRGMGNGDVNVGAQRMYDMMKKLENGGRV